VQVDLQMYDVARRHGAPYGLDDHKRPCIALGCGTVMARTHWFVRIRLIMKPSELHKTTTIEAAVTRQYHSWNFLLKTTTSGVIRNRSRKQPGESSLSHLGPLSGPTDVFSLLVRRWL
jgi:hypothetical protein